MFWFMMSSWWEAISKYRGPGQLGFSKYRGTGQLSLANTVGRAYSRLGVNPYIQGFQQFTVHTGIPLKMM